MASGDRVLHVLQAIPPGSSAATADVRVGGSTPAENITVFDFDAGSDEYMDFLVLLSGYDGGGLTLTLPWSASTATSGQTRWEAAFRALPDDTEDIDASHSYDYNGVSDTCASASGELSYPTIAFTNGSDMDSLADGEYAILRVHRDYDHGDDGMSGDAELLDIFGVET